MYCTFVWLSYGVSICNIVSNTWLMGVFVIRMLLGSCTDAPDVITIMYLQ
jgi:heme exporter protein D